MYLPAAGLNNVESSSSATRSTRAAAVTSPSLNSESRRCFTCNEICSILFDCLVYFTRFWGVLSATVLAGVSVDFIFHGRFPGYYLLPFSIIILFSETIWLVTLFLKLTLRNFSYMPTERPNTEEEFMVIYELFYIGIMARATIPEYKIWKTWKYFMKYEGWKKTPIYIFIGLLTIARPYKLWLTYLAGSCTIALGILHLSISVAQNVLKYYRKRRQDRFGHHSDLDSLESKFEVLDDGLPEPLPGTSVSLADSLYVEEQDTILEI